MSYFIGDLVDAVEVQTGLNTMFANATDPATARKVPFLQFLLNPMNRGGLQQSIVIGNGQKRTVQVTYDQEVDQARVESNATNPTCTDESYTDPNNYQDYTIDTGVNRKLGFTFSQDDLETAKVTTGEYFTRVLYKHLLALEVAVNDKEAAAAVLLTGAYSDDAVDWATDESDVSITNDELIIKTRKDNSSDPYPYTARQLREAIEYTGYSANPFIFSGTTLKSWSLDGQTFAAADYGIDLEKSFNNWGFAAMYDRGIATAFGDQSDFLIVQPGALQLLAFTKSDWTAEIPNVQMGANYYKTVVFCPRTGLPVDMVLTDNCGTISVKLYATTSLVGLPTDMFHPDGPYDGVTYVNKGTVTNVTA